MPHSFIDPPAWPLTRGQSYERFPLAETLRSPETTAGDLRIALRPLGRWGFRLGWDFLTPDQCADIDAAFTFCAGNWRSCPFLEWDTLTHDVLLSASWNGSSFVDVPLSFYEVASVIGYLGNIPLGAVLGPNTARPFAGVTTVLNYWPELGTVSVAASTITAAGGIVTDPVWLRIVGRAIYPKVKMDRASITFTARPNDPMMPGSGAGLWQCSITLVEDEIAA